MNAVTIDFSTPGVPIFNWDAPLTGFDATTQCALINIGTSNGSDRIFVDRGTTLKADAAQGKMVSVTWSQNTCNFAALATLSFVQSTDVSSDSDPLQSLTLVCSDLEIGSATLEIQTVSTNGDIRGVITTIAT